MRRSQLFSEQLLVDRRQRSASNGKAIEDLKLSTKLSGETPWHGKIEVTERPYGVAAERVKDLCETCAVAVLRSEI